MCVHKEEAKTKMDLVIEALSANTAALKAFTEVMQSGLVALETVHQEPERMSRGQ